MVIIELRGHVYVDAFHIFICCVHIFLLLLLFTALFTILVRFHRHKPKRNRISQKRRRRFALPTHSIASVYIHTGYGVRRQSEAATALLADSVPLWLVTMETDQNRK